MIPHSLLLCWLASLFFIPPGSSRMFDEGHAKPQESYDDSWMNGIFDLARKQRVQSSPIIDNEGMEVLEERTETLRRHLETVPRRYKTRKRIEKYLQSRDSLKLFQWELFSNLQRYQQTIPFEDPTVNWLINDQNALQILLTSGDIEDNNWGRAVEIVASIVRLDENAKSGWKLNLAIAVGLTFSSPVYSMADGSEISGITRYHNYVMWAEGGELFAPFFTLTAWHMRYVVGSWAQDDELVWARANVPEEFRDPLKIGSATHNMVEYKLYNDDGISVHDEGYYYGQPVTLEWIHAIGGVCGAISKFGSGMAQAFGIPALPVGQPGHCAFIWMKNGTDWYLDNDISGWKESTTHSGIHYTWKWGAPFFTTMTEAQFNLDSYRESEKMRILAEFYVKDADLRFTLLEQALTLCPQNYDAWMDLQSSLHDTKVSRKHLQMKLLSYMQEADNQSGEVENVALSKTVKASENEEGAQVIGYEGGEWAAEDPNSAWVEIDLGTPCSVDTMMIHWWGTSYSNDYDVLAEGPNDGEFVKVRSRQDEDREDEWYNAWGTLPGWEEMTRKIRVEMRDGSVDPWFDRYYFGIRQIVVLGRETTPRTTITQSRPVVTSGDNTGAEVLVDGDRTTSWIGKGRNAWVKIELPGLCKAEQVELEFESEIRGVQRIQYVVGGKVAGEEKVKVGKSEMGGYAGDIKVMLKGGKGYEINEVSATGYCYSFNEIFKFKLHQGFARSDKYSEPYTEFVMEDIESIIDEFPCDYC